MISGLVMLYIITLYRIRFNRFIKINYLYNGANGVCNSKDMIYVEKVFE